MTVNGFPAGQLPTSTCADCTRRIHGADARQGPDDRWYHSSCCERLFPQQRHFQAGQGALRFAAEEQRE